MLNPSVDSPIQIHLQPADQAPAVDEFTLAQFTFGEEMYTQPEAPSLLRLGLKPLAPDQAQIETWRCAQPVQRGFEQDVGFAHSPEILFGWIRLDEACFGDDMEKAAEYAYERIMQLHQDKGFAHLLRIWNYFPRLHEERDGLDRYQLFCLGRHRALERVALTEGALPAATAIGTHTPGLMIYFLAGREPGQQIENPRQVSAFHYPRRYGPKSPSFSRATLKHWGTKAQLYISGTASIVGHESQHMDVRAQLDEILANLSSLIGASGSDLAHLQQDPARLSLLKVYVRHKKDLELVQQHLQSRLSQSLPVLYLEGDVCREDLLVEIEGLYA